MITLYTILGSAGTTPRIVLDLCGVPYKRITVERDENGNNIAPAGYDELNPTGKVPTLVDGDLVLTEAAACALYVAAQHPEAGLMPAAGTRDGALTLRWLIFLTNTVQVCFLRRYYPNEYTADHAGTDGVQRSAEAQLSALAAILADAIGDGPFLVGESMTVADCFLAMLTGWGEDLPGAARWSSNATLARHYNNVAAVEAAGAALVAEGFPASFSV